MKHIEFGKGFYFLMDLQQYFKMVTEQMAMENISFDGKDLDFTYDLGDMKIELKQQQKADNTQSFEELKQKIEEKKTPL